MNFYLHWLYLLLAFSAPLFILLFKAHSRIGIIVNALLAISFGLCWYSILDWPLFFSFYLRYFYIIILILVISISFLKYNQKQYKPKRAFVYWLFLLIKGILILYYIRIPYNIFTGVNFTSNYVELQFPLKHGKYWISNGGNSEFLNHHYPHVYERYALDICKLNRYGTILKKNSFDFNTLENYQIFGDTVYSPCDGIVTEKNNLYRDHHVGKFDEFNTPGNYIAIKYGKYHFVELYHLQMGTILIQKGDSVKIGQALALVGNSGRSSGPHLHLNACIGENEKKKSVPILFNHQFVTRNDIINN